LSDADAFPLKTEIDSDCGGKREEKQEKMNMSPCESYPLDLKRKSILIHFPLPISTKACGRALLP